MSQISIKTFTLSSSTSTSSTKVTSSPKPKKSLKRSKPDSSPEINENDENSLEVIFDKSSDTLKPSKSKKAKKSNGSSTAESSTVNVLEDAENVPPQPKKHKKKSTDGNHSRRESTKSKKVAHENDANSSVLDNAENVTPPKIKTHKKKSTSSIENSMEIVLDSSSEAERSPKPKKSKKVVSDKTDDDNSVFEDAKNSPKLNNHKKKTPSKSAENSMEIVLDDDSDEVVRKPLKSKKKSAIESDTDENSAAMKKMEQKVKKHKKKSSTTSNQNLEEIILGNDSDVEKSSKPKTSKKAKKNVEGTSSMLKDDSVPNKQKAKAKPENLNTLEKAFAKSNPEKVSKPKKSKGDNNKNATAREDSDIKIKPPKKKKSVENGDEEKPKKSKKVVDKKDENSVVKVTETEQKPKKSHKKKVPANVNENSVGDLSDKTDGGTTSKLQKPKKLKPSPLLNASPPKSSPTKKNPATPNSAKKSTQQSIFGFCTLQSPAVSTGNDKANARECYEDALKALKKGQHFAFKQAINAAQKLSESSIELIESECFKFAVLKFRRNNFDDDENENYQKYERMLSQFSKNICEDTSILNSKAFPDLKLAMKNNPHSNLFGNCLAISQFFVSFPTYLDTSLKFSAKELLNAVTSGAEGYYKLTGEILAEFLHAFSTYEWFKGFKFFSAHIQDVTWNSNSASEILKLFLLRDISPLTREVKHSVDGKLHDIIKGNKSELEKKKLEADKKRRDTKTLVPIFDEELAKAFADKEFHELLPKQQILIFEHLIDLFMTDYFFTRQFEPEECKVIAREKIDEMKKELQEMIVKNQTMKRSEKRKEQEEKKPDQQYVKKKQNLEKKILIAERTFTLNQLNAALKPLPLTLGYDRFHRRYYIFQNSPNSGIYIEEFCQISLDESTEFEDDPIASELERFTVESARIPMKRSQWYRVSTKEELNEIKEILCKKGIRENLLLESIELNEATISATFNSQPQPRDLKFKEDESELGFLKAAMKKVFDRAQKYSLIHFSTTHAELIEKVSAANSFEELRTVIVASVPEILPCAFEPFSPGIKFFRITSWIRFAELCQSHSQMHALLLLLFEKIRTDKLFGAIACPRCDIRFDRIDRRADNSKPTIIACNLCYGYIHFKCHNEVTEIDPSPTEPSWICEVCKKIDTVEEDENEEEGKDVVENKPKSVIVGDKSLRATKAREKKDTESETTSSSRASSRNTVSQNSGWGNETTRSLRPRRQGANYSEISYVEEKVVRPKSKSSAAPEKKQVVKEEISDRYDDFCSDSRILSSLRPVKFEACENSEMTLDLLKSKLHKFKKITQLDAAFQSLREAATSHFKNNVRKFDEIQRHFKEFFGEEVDEASDDDDDFEATEEGIKNGDYSDIEIVEEDEDEDDEDNDDIEIIEDKSEEEKDNDEMEIIETDEDE